MTRSEEYLNEIRNSSGLKRAILEKLVVEGKTVTFHLATDTKYYDEDVAHAESVSNEFVPDGFTAKVRITKSVPEPEEVRQAIAVFLGKNFPAAAAFVTPEDIEVVKDENGGRFLVLVDREEGAMFSSGEILNRVSSELARRFCGAWIGDVKTVEKERTVEVAPLPPPEIVFPPRFFDITNYVTIDGGKPERAIYISDLESEAKDVTVCGKLVNIVERETKSGKPYFALTITDGTEYMRCNYFTKKATLEKVRALVVGDSVCLTGDNEIYNENLSFRVKQIDRGTPPEGFVPEARPSKPVPAIYRTVKPEPYFDLQQTKLFDNVPLPEEFKDKEFVVFDLETTGLNNMPTSGNMDKIIEIGAVRIKNGSVCEKFASFIACSDRLSQEIINLTGIKDDMLVGAPEVGAVMADFYKFCDGCILVGHNVTFDYKFVRYYAEKEGYIFDHKQYDTYIIAQTDLRLSNYKLNTLADYFGFNFNHHRAFEDAFVTAKVFIELIRQRKSLPN